MALINLFKNSKKNVPAQTQHVVYPKHCAPVPAAKPVQVAKPVQAAQPAQTSKIAGLSTPSASGTKHANPPMIFLDTCSLLDSCWIKASNGSVVYSGTKEQMFWNRELPALLAMGDAYLALRNYQELEKFAFGSYPKEGLTKRAQRILHKVRPLIESGQIQIAGDFNDPFADAILLSVALKFRTQRNLAFITQDRNLASDLDAIRHFKSVRPRSGYDIKIRRIGKSGAIEPHKQLSSN